MENYDETEEAGEEDAYLWDGEEDDGEGGEYEDGNGEEYGEGDENHVISSVNGRKVEKGVEYFKVVWDGGAETSWETKEVIAEYGGINELKKFKQGREGPAKQAGKAPADRTRERQRDEEKKRIHERENRKAIVLAELSRETPVPTYDLKKLESRSIPVAPPEPKEERSRVRTLRFLATKAFAAAVLLYEELSDFPTALKAPIFSILLKDSQLTASHLKVLLSTDQKRLDFSPAPSIIGMAHIEAIAERCHELEYIDLKDCNGVKSLAPLAARCHNLTYLDISRSDPGHLGRSLDDITKACGQLRVLKAVGCGLNSFLSSTGRHQKFLEELDVSENPALPASQALSRLIPGRCPNLRILRANSIFTQCSWNSAEQLFVEFSGELVTATFGSKANTVPRCRLEELRVGQTSRGYSWLSDIRTLETIFKCLDSPDSLRVLDLSTVQTTQKPSNPPFSRVITAYVNKADEYTPNLEELILRHFVPALRCDIEPRLPASLKHLDLFHHSLSQDQLTAMITPASSDKIPTAPFPRFSKLNVGSKETCVKAEPTMLFQFFRNGHHPWESLKLALFGDDASHSEVLSHVSAAHIVLQSQPFLKILDISSIRWMTPDFFVKVVHKDVLPNLESLTFSTSGSLPAQSVDNWLKSSSVPPKLTKLKLKACFYQSYTEHFPKLEFVKVVGSGVVDALGSWLEERDHPLPELQLCCCVFQSHRAFLTSIKNSNSEKSLKQMLVNRGELPQSAVTECDVFDGAHRVKCIVNRCHTNSFPYTAHSSYWI